MATPINDNQGLMSEPSHAPEDHDELSSDSAVSKLKTESELKSEAKKFKIIAAVIVLFCLGLFVIGGWWLGSKVWNEVQRQTEVKRIEAEENERLAAAKVAAKLAEKKRLQKEAEAAAKIAEEERLKQLTLEQRQQEEEMLAKARGGVFVKTEPSGATVTLAAEPVQKSPARFEVIKLGLHTITIEKHGYETIEREIEVKKDKVTDLGTLELTRETGIISILSYPEGASVLLRGKKVGITPLILEDQPTGIATYQLELAGYLSSEAKGRITVTDQLKLQVELKKRPAPVAKKSWENDLEMEFKPVTGLNILFGVDETRVKDFELFVKETGHDAVGGMRSLKDSKWGRYGHSWKNPGFEQSGEHPVVGVSWQDAKAFCKWLTRRDRETGVLLEKQFYRIPTDAEWSVAVGLREDTSGTPEQKNAAEKIQYPWGTQWPPPEDVGNFAGREVRKSEWPKGWGVITDYMDDYPRTSPVGRSRLKRNGLRDMSGNVWEWCEDTYKIGEVWRVLRGGSWATTKSEELLSSRREYYGPSDRYSFIGFRCVVVY